MVLVIAFALVAAACSSDDGGDTADTTTTEASETTETTVAAADTTATTAAAETTTTTEANPEKPYGGEAIVGDSQEPPTLNPFVPGGDNFIVSIIGQGYHTGVQEIDGYTLSLIPELLTELPTIANGGVTLNDDGTMTVKYVIKDEAMWEDGTPISGDDFLFTYEIIMDPDLPVDKTTIEDIDPDSIIVGDKTFEFTLAAPTALYEFIFGLILPKHSIEGSDFVTDWNDKQWASGGPFIFSEWATGEFIKLVRNDNYWKKDPETGQQLPYLDTVEFRFLPEADGVVQAFKEREVDVIYLPPFPETIDRLVALESEGARVDLPTGPVWEHINFQFGLGRFEMNKSSLNSNLDYRRAVAYLIDRDAIARAVSDYTSALPSYVDAFSPALSHQAWDRYPYDPDKARELLRKIKEEEHVETITAVYNTSAPGDVRIRIGEALKPMFDAVGIDFQIELQDSQLFFGETLDNGTWDIGEWAWVGTPGLANLVAIHDVFDPDAPPPDGSNYYRWGTEDSSVRNEQTERFAELHDLMNETVDVDELEDLIAEAEDILADQMVILPLYSRLVVGAVWEDEITNFVMNPSQAAHTWNIEEWYRADI